MRLQKYLSQAGVSSRRKAEELMAAGRVAINGKVVRELGTRVNPDRDRVEVDGKVVSPPQSFVYLAVNKPSNYITSLHDPEGRPTVTELLPKNMPRVWPVGRLDWDSEGLLLMTNDGNLTNLLTHPSHEVPKTYAVKVRGLYASNAPEVEQLRQGVEIEPGEVTGEAQVQVVRDNGRNTWLEITIREGKHRQIRRMCEAVGAPVMKLRRLSMGSLTIDGIPSGSFRSLSHAEVAGLYGELDSTIPHEARPSRRAQKRIATDKRGATDKPRARRASTAPRSGGPKTGGPKSGAPRSGGPKSGGPKAGGAPKSGAPKSGSPKSGSPKSGSPKSGAPKGGNTKPGGAPKSGAPKSGSPKSGSPKSGNTKPGGRKPTDRKTTDRKTTDRRPGKRPGDRK